MVKVSIVEDEKVAMNRKKKRKKKPNHGWFKTKERLAMRTAGRRCFALLAPPLTHIFSSFFVFFFCLNCQYLLFASLSLRTFSFHGGCMNSFSLNCCQSVLSKTTKLFHCHRAFFFFFLSSSFYVVCGIKHKGSLLLLFIRHVCPSNRLKREKKERKKKRCWMQKSRAVHDGRAPFRLRRICVLR